MLNVKSNRIDYSDLLAPPSDYVLTKAIGTTYSLDLYALLAIPVAMFYSKSMEGDFQQSRYDVLDAIRQSEKVVDLFCQRGKIAVPKKYNDLLAFMEGAIIEVLPPNAISSFHPKIWVLRFESDKDVLYRLAVLSRNLTFDRSWDIACFTEGKPSKKRNPESKKLSDYLNFLYSRTEREIDLRILKELSTVEFEYPTPFDSLEIFPILGFDNQYSKFPNPILDKAYNKMLIISPFLEKKILKKFLAKNDDVYLISRAEELNKINNDKECKGLLKEFEKVYCLNSLVVEGEHCFDTEGNEPMFQNLHAKIFIGTNGRENEWYLGSANCSKPAFERNAELMLKLNSTNRDTNVSSIIEELTLAKSNLFHEYSIPTPNYEEEDENENIEHKLRLIHFDLAKAEFIGTITPNTQNQNYDIQVDVKISSSHSNDFSFKLSLIHRKEKQKDIELGVHNSLVFKNVALTKLSEFLVVHIYYKNEKRTSLLVKMDVEIPSERDDTIFKNLINSKVKFFQYLQFLLSPNDFNSPLEILGLNEAELKENEEHQTSVLAGITNSPIYEYLMIAASRTPKKLKEIDNIVKRLEKMNSDVVEDFLPIWNVFKEFAHE